MQHLCNMDIKVCIYGITNDFLLLRQVVYFVFLFLLLSGGLKMFWHQESGSKDQNFINWNKKVPCNKNPSFSSVCLKIWGN